MTNMTVEAAARELVLAIYGNPEIPEPGQSSAPPETAKERQCYRNGHYSVRDLPEFKRLVELLKVEPSQEQLPPGEYMCKIVDFQIEPGQKPGDLKAMLTVDVPGLDSKLKVEAGSFHGNVLNQDAIERLARVAWENTGKEGLPVLPPGQVWIDKATNKQIDPKDLVTAWEQIGTKEIFRRQAAAVAQALGFKLGADVTVTPHDLIKGAQAPLRGEIAKLLVQHIVQSMERESAILQPVPQVFMRDPYALLDLIRKEANVSAEEMDAWMLEAQPSRRKGRPGA